MPLEGMLLQLDGSHHDEIGATGTAPYALFQEQEDTKAISPCSRASLQAASSGLILENV